jgi:hypothetical protein
LEPVYFWTLFVKVARFGLLVVLGQPENVDLVADLFPDTAANVTHPVSDVTQELIAKVLTRVGHSIPRQR